MVGTEERAAECAGASAEKPIFDVTKRIFDVFCSLIGLIIASPVFLVIAVCIKKEDGGSVFYSHERVGMGGKPIRILKFRSMKPDSDKLLTAEQLAEYKKEYKLKNDPRLTKTGAFIRKTSLDELPQLINILMGDMSLIGPRPILRQEMDENYSPDQIRLLCSVKPGLTGYWAAYARNNTGYSNGERQKMELFYCRNRSVLLDIKILFKTAAVVLSRRGAY